MELNLVHQVSSQRENLCFCAVFFHSILLLHQSSVQPLVLQGTEWGNTHGAVTEERATTQAQSSWRKVRTKMQVMQTTKARNSHCYLMKVFPVDSICNLSNVITDNTISHLIDSCYFISCPKSYSCFFYASSARWSSMPVLLARPSQLDVKGPAPACQDLKV